MKIKKIFIYGIILLLLITFSGCSAKESPIDETTAGTAEGVAIAYLSGFSNRDFDQIESMLESSSSIGDVYYNQTGQPPKSSSEMIKSQYEFITHFYGEDAWENVEYKLKEISLETANNSDSESDNAIKEYRADLLFNDMAHHLLGYENIHIIISNESGAWMIKEGLSWDKNLYGENPAPEYFKGSEASYRGINGDSSSDDLGIILGAPVNLEEEETEGYVSYVFEYEDASYYFYGSLLGNDKPGKYYLEYIAINSGDYSLPRDIKLGDSFYSVMEKFPRDKDWLIDPNNCFYGISTLDGFGGACFSYEDENMTHFDTLVLVPTEYVPYFKMEFTDGILKSAMLVYIHTQ